MIVKSIIIIVSTNWYKRSYHQQCDHCIFQSVRLKKKDDLSQRTKFGDIVFQFFKKF